MLRQLSDRNQRTRTFEPRHVTLVCLLLLLLVICFGLLYEVKPSSLKNRHREISPFGRKELRLPVTGRASRSDKIEEKEEGAGGKRGEIDELQESKVDEEDSEVGDDEIDFASDGEVEEEEEELEEMDDLVNEEEGLEEEEDVEREVDGMGKQIDGPSRAMEERASSEGEKSSL
ncbi:uncharacterized protein LOC115675902 [Syzygium oleosum]|uniref:uncharacterized protein LOC115675902 n=1 Tax=Syzygium oleosum TaxID=219896 RepID=UPI0024BA6F84|nr:uncharacterized protein LOC115675902 [Syzygium oleosum]